MSWVTRKYVKQMENCYLYIGHLSLRWIKIKNGNIYFGWNTFILNLLFRFLPKHEQYWVAKKIDSK